MSANLLRRAAALMRERATEPPIPPGPWETEFSDVIRTDLPFGAPGYLIAEGATLAEAHHIASWHPAVALAVADRLETAAHQWEQIDKANSWLGTIALTYAHLDDDLNVARAYLGEGS